MRIVPRQENYLLNIAYYKLRDEENLAYYVIGQGIKSYRIGGTHEILNLSCSPGYAASRKPWGRS